MTGSESRGGVWVFLQLAQFVLLLILLIVGIGPYVPQHRWQQLVGAMLALFGGILGLWSFSSLGTSLSIFPRPLAGGRLVRSGPYRLVRHPMYDAVLLICSGGSLWSGNILALVLCMAMIVFFALKARQEEIWLSEKYRRYAEYQKSTWRLIPWIY